MRKIPISFLMDSKRFNKTSNKLTGLRSNPLPRTILYLRLSLTHYFWQPLSSESPLLIGSSPKLTLTLWWKALLQTKRVWRFNLRKISKLDSRMLQEWRTPKKKLLSLLISSRKVINMSKWVRKSQKEPFSQVHQVQVKLCWPKHVLDKPGHPFFMYPVLNL